MMNMKKYGLIGYPIAHSMSPALFKAAYGGAYLYELIEEADFEVAYQQFLQEYDAINVTAPFKEAACAKADVLSAECECIGACNVLKKTEEGVFAANTDYLGVMKSLIQHQEIGLKPLTVVVGCGGAGKAAAYAACELGHEVVILNRTLEKAVEFVDKLRSMESGYSVSAGPLSAFKKCFQAAGTIIYTVPEFLPEIKSLRKCELRGGVFRSHPKVILEANYRNPAFTAEILAHHVSINPKITYVSGLEWLLDQAVEAYGIFTGKEPNIQEMIKVL